MAQHVIRLRGPWEYEIVSPNSREPRPQERVRMQGRWPTELLAANLEAIRLHRRFHRPTGLESGDRVWLRIDDAAGLTGVKVNEHVLEPSAEQPQQAASRTSWRFDITSQLAATNELTIEAAGQAVLKDGPVEVTVEIESPDA